MQRASAVPVVWYRVRVVCEAVLCFHPVGACPHEDRTRNLNAAVPGGKDSLV